MRIERFFDLSIANIEAGEPVREDILDQGGFDLVRIHEPALDLCAPLILQGFVYKPKWVIWLRPVCASAEEYLQSFGGHARKHLLTAKRRIEAAFRIKVEYELQEKTFKRWYALYEQRMRELAHGYPYAAEDYEVFLAEPKRFVAIYIYNDDHLVAGSLNIKVPQHSLLRGIYFASDTAYHHYNLSRYIYFISANVARELGYQQLSLGVDPNFYGHDVSTGLYRFKKSIGCHLEPADIYEPSEGSLLEKVISLTKCEDPSFCLGFTWPDPAPDHLDGHIFSRQANPDVTSFEADFLSQIYLHRVSEQED